MATLFDEKALAAIGQAVRDAEQGTSGEIVVVAADRSDAYAFQRALASLGAATTIALAVLVLAPAVHAGWLVVLFPLACVLGFALSASPALLRLFVPDDVVEGAVRRAAQVAFLERGLHRTRDRSGVLVFLSIAERRVRILGDEGIHKVVGDDGWKAFVGRIVASIAAGKAEDIAAVIQDMGAMLGTSFPRRADDTNELPDAVVVQR